MEKLGKIIVIILIIILAAIGILFGLRYFGIIMFGEPIKIGFINALTGDVGNIGLNAKSAVEIAVSEINQNGGIRGHKLEVIYEDGRCRADTALEVGTKLIQQDKVPVIIGGLCSGETMAFSPLAMEKKVIVISNGSSAPKLSQMGKYFFRNFPSDALQGKIAAEYSYNELGSKKAVVLYIMNDWGYGVKGVFEKRFTDLGGAVLFSEGISEGAYDYRPVFERVKASGADIVYFVAFPSGSKIAIKQARDLGVDLKFMGGDGWDDPALHKDVNGLGELYYVAPKITVTDIFKTKMLSKTGSSSLTMGSANAYDIVYIIAEALRKAGTNPEKLEKAIRATSYDGVSGYVAFDENGDLTNPIYSIKKIENGTATELR